MWSFEADVTNHIGTTPRIGWHNHSPRRTRPCKVHRRVQTSLEKLDTMSLSMKLPRKARDGALGMKLPRKTQDGVVEYEATLWSLGRRRQVRSYPTKLGMASSGMKLSRKAWDGDDQYRLITT